MSGSTVLPAAISPSTAQVVLRRFLSTTLCLWALAGGLAAAGPATSSSERVKVDVVEVSGLLDPISVDFVSHALREAQRDRVEALIVRLDSSGSVVADRDLQRLIDGIRASEVPVAVWVGPGRAARATGGAFELFSAGHVRGVAPESRVGALGAERALEERVATVSAATLGDFVVGLDGTEGIEIPTTVLRREGRPPQRQLAPAVEVRFDEPSLLAQTLHAVATPSAAYLLLVIGLLLVLFEFFTAGVGVAAGVAAVCLGLASYGLGVLPTRPVGLGLLVLATVGYGIDVQSGAPRAWTAIGTIAFVTGSFFLFADGISVPLAMVVAGIVGVALFMIAGMPAMVRTRFSTPTIGRESMLGEEGIAVSDVDPDGVVTVREAPWRARTNRATPIRAGEALRVAGIDGLLLEVEPLEGAAKDAGH